MKKIALKWCVGTLVFILACLFLGSKGKNVQPHLLDLTVVLSSIGLAPLMGWHMFYRHQDIGVRTLGYRLLGISISLYLSVAILWSILR